MKLSIQEELHVQMDISDTMIAMTLDLSYDPFNKERYYRVTRRLFFVTQRELRSMLVPRKDGI